jgi:hypothetical protein
MHEFHIDTRANRVEVRWGAAPGQCRTQTFTRRWEALLLACLLEQSQAPDGLDAQTFQGIVRDRGQDSPLNRAQWQRLLNNVQSFLDGWPALQARVETPPRKRTVGPWRLVLDGPVMHAVDGRSRQADWPHPSLTEGSDIQRLLEILIHLLGADALAVEGRFGPAIEVLQGLDGSGLTPEGRGVLWLRLCSWHKHLGRFDAARECARQVLAEPCAQDPGLAQYARFFISRIDYDQNPAASLDVLWRTTAEVPIAPLGGGTDWRTLSEWHNLRALLARRRMHALAGRPAGCPAPSQSDSVESVPSLHRLAVQHLQAAIYMACWSRDWDRLQAYVANLAYHLQSVLPLAGAIDVQVAQVLQWHRLTMAYEDKFSAGRDSAWEYIFFARFWLEHQTAFQTVQVPDPLAHNLGDLYPDQEAFYQRALVRLRECGDDRQVAIGHSLYLRFAQQHMPPVQAEPVVEQQCEQLRRLLRAQPDRSLLDNLFREGYARHWPADVLPGKLPKRRKIQRIQKPPAV